MQVTTEVTLERRPQRKELHVRGGRVALLIHLHKSLIWHSMGILKLPKRWGGCHAPRTDSGAHLRSLWGSLGLASSAFIP